MRSALVRGAVAGAVGTVALNMVTYLDMAVRGRSPSTMPGTTAGRLAGAAGIDLGAGDTEQNRTEGLGALLGYLTGLAVGAIYGVVQSRMRLPTPVAAVALGAGAMAGTDVPLTALGLTDPRRWSVSDWAADVVPHVAYGAATAAVYAMLRD